MKIVAPYYEIISIPESDMILKNIERAARICYKSEDKIQEGSALNLIKRLIKSGHHSVLEHASVSVRIVCDRGISHEVVRHRLCSFSQESTRYANYSKDKFGNEITVIKPFFWEEDSAQYQMWLEAMGHAEKLYLKMIESGALAQEARSVLPNSLKTEIFITANLREWHHIFSLRCAKASHPQIRQIMLPLLANFNNQIPAIYESLYEKYALEISEFSKRYPLRNED